MRSRNGDLVSVASVATLTREEGANSIPHYNLNRSISVTAVPNSGVSWARPLSCWSKPATRWGATTSAWPSRTGARGAQSGRCDLDFVQPRGGSDLSAAGRFYESFIDPLIILLTVPIALMGALIGLKLRGLPLDVYGQMGPVLVSLAAKNGILIVEFANQRLAAGLELGEAIHGAAVSRMRPILLTAITCSVSCPFCWRPGRLCQTDQHWHGGVSGLLVSSLLSLFVVPFI